MKNKTLFNSLFLIFSITGSFLVLDKPLKADQNTPACPDPSVEDVSSVGLFDNDPDPNSFISRTNALGANGYCYSTPDQYGVKVFKMGLCKQNPGNPTGSSKREGQEPDYTSCTWSFESTVGENADFEPGGFVDLSGTSSSVPAAGTYSYAAIVVSNKIRLKGKYGPVGGETHYSITEFDNSSTNISDYAVTLAPVTSFGGPNYCVASIEGGSVSSGIMSGYILNNTGTIIESEIIPEKEDSDRIFPCPSAEKILGVVGISNDLTISDATKGLKTTFGVADAMNVMVENGKLVIAPNGFKVNFEAF